MKTAEDWKKRFRDRFREKTFPPRVIKDLEKFEPSDTVKTLLIKLEQEKGKGIYLYGNAGSGKTVLAAMLLEALRLKDYLHPAPLLKDENGEHIHRAWAYFVSVCDLFAELRTTFSNQEHSEMEIIEKYSEAKYLVLDDIGIEKTTDWTFQTLYLIVNRRYEYLRPTIFTSNLSLQKLAEQLGDDRIPSRIFGMCYIHGMENADRRLEG